MKKITAQQLVNLMGEAVAEMRLTPTQRELVKAAFRAAIQYAEMKHAGLLVRHDVAT